MSKKAKQIRQEIIAPAPSHIPYILAGLFLILVLISNIHTFLGITQDIGLHLRLGQIIWQQHIIPKINYFSYISPDFPWYNDYWLSKVVMYLGWMAVGLKGLTMLTAILWTTAFTLSLFAYRKKEALPVAIAVAILPVFIVLNRTAVRPEMFSFLFLSIYLFLLFGNKEKFLWVLPVVQLFWVNSHIYFFLGPAFYLLFLLGNAIKTRLFTFKDKKVLIGLLVCLVNFISPYGIRGAFYPFLVFENYGVPILENLSPFFVRRLYYYGTFTIDAFFLAVIISCVGLFLNRKNIKNNIFETGVLFLSISLSLKMIRNFPIFALATIPITAKNFYESGILLQGKKTLVSIGATLILAIFLFINGTIYAWALVSRKFELTAPAGPDQAIDFIRANGLKGPLFNNGEIGSYLIWKLPEEKVAMDSRPEAYSAEFLKNVYIPIQTDPSQWKTFADKYKINYVFFAINERTAWAQHFLKRMIANADWPLVYLDQTVVIFAKSNEQNKKLIQQTENFRKHSRLVPIESLAN